MRHVPRELESSLTRAIRSFPAIVLTGPRRSGKTWLLRHLFADATYRLIEAPDVVSRLRADPQGFLDDLEQPAILDEIQHAPELLPYIRARIDRQPRRTGRWILTGSQEAPFMKDVTESLAGRAAVLQLLPMSCQEHTRVSPLRGGYPEVLARPSAAALWFSSYVQTYLERDLRAITAVRDLPTFRRFMAVLAMRHGQMLNKTDLAAPLGVSVPTITQWLNVLEMTGQVSLVQPFYENLGKRLIKSPKVYFTDSGLACHLLGIESTRELSRSPFFGAILEGFVAAEILKAQVNSGGRKELYYFRDQQGLEVDFVLPRKGHTITLLEVKATRTPTPAMASPLRRLADAIERRNKRTRVQALLVHRSARYRQPISALAPGVRAVAVEDFVQSPLG